LAPQDPEVTSQSSGVPFLGNPRPPAADTLACSGGPGSLRSIGWTVVVRAEIIPLERVERVIFVLRGHKVILDNDLAAMYGVEPRALNQAVKRNLERFPRDFMFQLSAEEVDLLRSQNVISSWGGRRYLSYAFTEQGVAMLRHSRVDGSGDEAEKAHRLPNGTNMTEPAESFIRSLFVINSRACGPYPRPS